MKYSEYQKAIFRDVLNGIGNTAVIARAGSGKTFCILESFKFVPKNKNILAIAFAANIAEELKKKTKIKADISTLHSLGLKVIKGKYSSVIVDVDKTEKIIKSLIEYKFYPMIDVFKKAVSLCKMSLQDSPDKMYDLFEKYDIDYTPFTKEEFANLIVKILGKCKQDTLSVDYDDMIWFIFVYNFYLGNYDYVFIDEAQDLNPAQLFMVKKLSNDKNRIFLFYDDRQAIFGFRCADVNYLNDVVDKLNCKKLPLPISYRCPKKVVELAKKYVPDYQTFEDSIEGSVEYIKSTNYIEKISDIDNCIILSRYNAPLVDIYYQLLKHKIPAKIKGKDIANNLIGFINSFKASTFDVLRTKINKWETNEVNNLKKQYKKYDHIQDKANLARNLMGNCSTISELKELIKKLFVNEPEENVILLSSIHSFKGGEKKNVFVLDKTLNYNSPGEEENIIYIAYTRAKENLYLIEGNV